MNNVFWIGVYPGLTSSMLDFAATSITTFIAQAKDGHDSARAPFAQLI